MRKIIVAVPQSQMRGLQATFLPVTTSPFMRCALSTFAGRTHYSFKFNYDFNWIDKLNWIDTLNWIE